MHAFIPSYFMYTKFLKYKFEYDPVSKKFMHIL